MKNKIDLIDSLLKDNTLSDRERKLYNALRDYFANGSTMRDVAEKYSLSEATLCRRKKKLTTYIDNPQMIKKLSVKYERIPQELKKKIIDYQPFELGLVSAKWNISLLQSYVESVLGTDVSRSIIEKYLFANREEYNYKIINTIRNEIGLLLIKEKNNLTRLKLIEQQRDNIVTDGYNYEKFTSQSIVKKYTKILKDLDVNWVEPSTEVLLNQITCKGTSWHMTVLNIPDLKYTSSKKVLVRKQRLGFLVAYAPEVIGCKNINKEAGIFIKKLDTRLSQDESIISGIISFISYVCNDLSIINKFGDQIIIVIEKCKQIKNIEIEINSACYLQELNENSRIKLYFKTGNDKSDFKLSNLMNEIAIKRADIEKRRQTRLTQTKRDIELKDETKSGQESSFTPKFSKKDYDSFIEIIKAGLLEEMERG